MFLHLLEAGCPRDDREFLEGDQRAGSWVPEILDLILSRPALHCPQSPAVHTREWVHPVEVRHFSAY